MSSSPAHAGYCRSCLAPAAPGAKCARCGRGPVLHHAELNTLAIAHIDCDAYFSEEDQRAATFMDGPAYPGVTYIVISVVEGEVRGTAGFDWNDEASAFAEMSVEVKG